MMAREGQEVAKLQALASKVEAQGPTYHEICSRIRSHGLVLIWNITSELIFGCVFECVFKMCKDD